MVKTLVANWALLIGVALLMLGHGLQSSLLGIRANLEDFPTAITGLIMSGYSFGFLVSATVTPIWVRRVGHVRVFAAFAALASTAILAHVLFVEPISWFALRFVTGVCISGVYIVTESWLNASTGNEERGQLLSVYMVVQLTFAAGCQLLLTTADPGGTMLFIVVSVLISVAVVPLLLSSTIAPTITTPRSFTVIDLYRFTPLGCVAMIGIGLCQASLFNMGAVFGQNIGLTIPQISILLAAAMLSGMLLQWPIGYLSDRFDRRSVLVGITGLAALSMFLVLASGTDNYPLLLTLFSFYGGLCMPMYSVCLAYTNDYLDPEDMVAASGALMFAAGIGTIIGPLMIAVAMQVFGDLGFVTVLGLCNLSIGIFAIYRMTRREALPLEDQGQHVMVATAAAPSPVLTSITQEAAIDLVEAEQAH